LLIERALKVAKPEEAVLLPPLSVPEPGLFAMASVTLAELFVTILPN
jgi:hypothetical protein